MSRCSRPSTSNRRWSPTPFFVTLASMLSSSAATHFCGSGLFHTRSELHTAENVERPVTPMLLPIGLEEQRFTIGDGMRVAIVRMNE